MPEPLPVNSNLREQFVTEQIPVGLPWRLLTFSVIVFGFSLFIYFGLKFGYETYLNARAEQLDKNIEDLASRVSKEEQQNFINFYSQLVNLEKALDRHKFSSNVYSFLERNTLPLVYYYEGDFLVNGGTLGLRGRADSLEALVQQLSVFDKSSELEKTVLDQMSFEGNDVNFGITLTFKSDFLNLPKQ